MKHISGFDSLRAVSIILVILGHLGLFHWLPENEFVRLRVWQIISGTTGVQIFFTISGFLITTILLNEKKQKSRINFKNFFARRFLRLLPPLIIFYSAIAVLMASHWIDSTGVGFLFSICYLYNFIPEYYYTSELGHTWSLAVEEQFYLTWPFLLQFVNNKLVIAVIISVLLLISAMLFYTLPILKIKTYSPERFFIPAAAPILIGAGAAILNSEFAAMFSKLVERKILFLLAGLFLFIFPLYTPIVILSLTPIPQALGIGLVLIWMCHNQEARLMPYWNNAVLRYVGKISYGLYVYQGLFLRTGPTGELAIQKFPINILLTFIVAIISYELVEKFALKLKSRFSD